MQEESATTARQSPAAQEAASVSGPPPGREQRRVFRWFFFGAFAFLIWQLLQILSLFSDVIIWASALTLVCFPVNVWLQRRMPARPGTAAALSTLAVLLVILVPTIVITSVVVQQSAELYPTVRGWIGALREPGSTGFADVLPGFLLDYWGRARAFVRTSPLFAQFDLGEFMLARINATSAQIANFGAGVARNVLLGFVNLLLILALMFFCFRDGERFLHWLAETVPMPRRQVEAIGLRVYTTVTAVIRGALLTAAIQGILAVIGYGIAGVPLAVFFGVVTGIVALIPVVGAALVWAPIGVFVFGKEPGWGVFVLAWGFFVVSLVDNFLKPVLIGSQARMPILLIFVGVIGGVNVYGFTGVMIGPIVIACLLAFFNIYRDHYSMSPAPDPLPPEGY